MNTAKFVNEITVIDPDSKLPVEMSVFKHENGGMFAMDSSYLEQNFDDDGDPVIADPFNNDLDEMAEGIIFHLTLKGL